MNMITVIIIVVIIICFTPSTARCWASAAAEQRPGKAAGASFL